MTGEAPGYATDKEHRWLRVSLVDPAGRMLAYEEFAAPVNKSAVTPHELRIEVVHADGCSRQIQTQFIPCY